MHLGVTIFATDRSIDMATLARAVEDRGFHSLWLPEHTHIPVSRRTPPPVGGGELPEEYRRTLDPIVALTAAATVTSRLRVGTGILLPAQREPIVTAKALASLDLLSGGRLEVGVGFGWNEDELEHHGVAMSERRGVVAESVAAMRALWTEDEAAYAGAHVSFSPSWSWPKPLTNATRPHLPVLLGGGDGPKLRSHLVEWADGWIPIGGAGLSRSIPVLHEELAAAGRDPSTFGIVPFGSVPTPGKLEHFAEIGVTECVVRLPSAGEAEVLNTLDEYAPLVEFVAAMS
ncbi:MAG: LLM class F420-dependent oxidoreductase [Acidimicrobiia bacterium]|nr:LLM class F420-dependent oxidoreductase [Acidimicrobiia bacterium]